MIKIEIETDDDGHMRIEARGHGDPLVCAAVSATMQSAALYLKEMEKQYGEEMVVTIK